MTTALWWVRRDLRLHDNPTLVAASDADSLLPVYVVDPREYGQRPYGGTASFAFEKTGAHRTRFRRESVTGLRETLTEDGSALLVREGRPEAVLAELADEFDADSVHFQRLPGTEERLVADAVRDRLRGAGVATDSRDRYFNIGEQATQYDGDAEYVKHWLPELADVPAAKSHEPWTLRDAKQAEHGVVLGEDYPEPMVDLEASYEHLRG